MFNFFWYTCKNVPYSFGHSGDRLQPLALVLPFAVQYFCGVLGKVCTAAVPARVLLDEHVTFFVRVHVGDVAADVVTVGALVHSVVPAVASSWSDLMVSPVLVPVVDIVADDFSAVHAYALVAEFAAHDGRINACEFLGEVCVREGFASVPSWDFFVAEGTLYDLFVVTVLAHFFLHARSWKAA